MNNVARFISQFASDFPVMWFKQASGLNANDVPISTNNILITQESRFSLDRDGDTYTLQVRLCSMTEGIMCCAGLA